MVHVREAGTSLLLTLACLSCSCGQAAEQPAADEPSGCTAENPLRSEADAHGDRVFAGCASPAPGSSQAAPVTCDASTIEAVERDCALDSAPCSGAVTISRAAALCIAAQGASLTSLEGPYAELIYHARYRKPVWNVFTISSKTARGERSGSSYSIDATNGELLTTTAWAEMAD